MSMPAIAGVGPEETEVVFGESFLGEYGTGDTAGLALVLLGHAVDHLESLCLFDLDADTTRDGRAAVRILMQMSSAIFSEWTGVARGNGPDSRWRYMIELNYT